MSVRLKLASFALALLLAFGAGALVGTAIGPIDTGSTSTTHLSDHNG